MKFLILLMLITCATCRQDLTGKMFLFPQEGNTARVIMTPPISGFSAITVCHRSFTDLERDHSLLSMATNKADNEFLVYYYHSQNAILPHVRNQYLKYGRLDYKPNTWHSICTTWDGSSGLVQVWFNGQPLIKKYVNTAAISGYPTIILGQEQDSAGGTFDTKQSFVGMMTDVHMWRYVLSACEIQKYMNEQNFTPGNLLNWAALDFKIIGRVLIESKQMTFPQTSTPCSDQQTSV